MFYDIIYLAKGFRMRPKVWSTLNEYFGKQNSDTCKTTFQICYCPSK